MSDHRSITICISDDVFKRIARLAPSKQWGRNDKRDFYTQIFLDGLEHRRFIDREHKRDIQILKMLNSLLKSKAAQSDKASTDPLPSRETLEMLAKTLDRLTDPRPESPSSQGATGTEPAPVPGPKTIH